MAIPASGHQRTAGPNQNLLAQMCEIVNNSTMEFILPYLLANSRNSYGYGQWETVHFVILSLTGWAHTQNDLHNHSGNMDSVNERQHYLKPSLNLAGAIPRIITAIYRQLLSFNHILNMGAAEIQHLVSQYKWCVILACDQEHRPPPITTAFAVMICSGYNNGCAHGSSLDRAVCDEFIWDFQFNKML